MRKLDHNLNNVAEFRTKNVKFYNHFLEQTKGNHFDLSTLIQRSFREFRSWNAPNVPFPLFPRRNPITAQSHPAGSKKPL